MSARVAVVECDDSIRELLAKLLAGRGYEVQAYASVATARAGFRSVTPDMLVLDAELPDGSGLDLVGSLRSEGGKPVPSIVVSGARAEKDIVRAFQAGATDFLPKPFKPDELLARCAVHLARSTEFGAQSSDDIELPQKRGLAFGRYRILRELGRGGYGRVYLAEDEARRHELVALKVLSALSGESLETRLRFIRETYSLSGVHHPRVVEIHDVGSCQGRLYFAMEYVEGVALSSLVTKRGVLHENEAREVLAGLLEALEALDARGIVHRDLKPGNVILRGGRTSEPVLIDFGLAKRHGDRGITQPDVVVGTVSFLAPEVVRGRDGDSRSDLFSLGLTLRYALTGEEVFPWFSGVDLMTAMASTPIPPVEAVSPGFSGLLLALWDRDPDRRPASPREAFERLLALPPLAAPPTRTTRRSRGL